MNRTGPLLVVVAFASAAGALASCSSDSGCFEQVASGWIALPEPGSDAATTTPAADAGTRDAARRPPVVVVNGDDAAPDAGAVNRDDAGTPPDAADASPDASPDATLAAEAGPPVAAGPDGAAAGDASATATWEGQTCDRICAQVLDPRWVIRGCRPPERGKEGKLYVYCDVAASTCTTAE